MQRSPRLMVWVLISAATALLLVSCGRNNTTPTKIEPASVQINQETGLGLVTLTEAAVTRTGIETAEVATERSPREGEMFAAVPYSSVIYDKYGATWTYVVTDERTYLREPITIDHIEGDWAYLTNGPDTGTVVVSIGAAELYGTETGIGK